MTVNELAQKLNAEVLSMPSPDSEITGGYCGDLLSWVMGRAQCGNAWITIMSNINVAAVASLSDVACVILAEGVKPDATKDAAESKNSPSTSSRAVMLFRMGR